MVIVACFSFPYEAHIARAKLESIEIPAQVIDEHTVTGSLSAMAVQISIQTFWAFFASFRQTSGRSGQPSQQPAFFSNSPGARNPSCCGVERNVFGIIDLYRYNFLSYILYSVILGIA